MAAQNSNRFPSQACLIADLSSDVQHQILNIGNYVFRPLNFILAFLSFVFNTLVIIAVARTKSLQYPAMVMMCSLAVTDIIFPQYSMYRYIEVFTHEHKCPTSHIICTHSILPSVVFVSWQRLVTWLLLVEIAIWQSEDLCGILITWQYHVLLRQCVYRGLSVWYMQLQRNWQYVWEEFTHLWY